MRAYLKIPEGRVRANAFQSGLAAANLKAVNALPDPRPGDVLVTWNRYGQSDYEAKRFEKAGAAVLVAENGYLGHTEDEYRKPYHANGEQLYALALWQHNGAGVWYEGEPGRWREQGIEVTPWRIDGEHVLVLPQRSIGPPGVAMPQGWPAKTCAKLLELTKRKIKERPHPGNNPTLRPLEKDLANAWCAVTWGSGSALKGLCAGVPCFSDPASPWIGRACSFDIGEDIEKPLMDDFSRERMLSRVAWAQWTVSEITSGEPFARLMAVYLEQRKAA